MKEINLKYSLEGLMLKLKLQYFGHLMLVGKDRKQVEKGTEDMMVGWYHWLNGHEIEHILRDGEGQGSLPCCNPWGRKESDMTDWTTIVR